MGSATIGTQKEFAIKQAADMLPVVSNNKVFIVADTETTGFGA